MSVTTARPEVSQLVMHLLGRSVHPELIDARARRVIAKPGYEATVSLCDSGHVISFRCGEQTVTEFLGRADHVLPERQRLFRRPLNGSRTESRLFDGGLRYQLCQQTEQLDPEVFGKLTEELLHDGRRAELCCRFAAGNRLAPTAVSLIRADAQPDGLLLHAFHTFPACRAVVRSQTLFEL